MMRRWWLLAGVVAAGAAAAGVLLFSAGGPAGARPERFILIIVDSLRADHLGCYGSEQGLTPNIDAFAAQALRFDNAYAASSYTFASNAALLTSKYPHEVRGHQPSRVADEATTLAEYFKAARYDTAAFSAHFIISRTGNFEQGFDTFHHADRQDDAIIKRCCNWLSRHHDRKYFVMLYLWDPHLPYRSQRITPELRAKLARVRAKVRTGDPPLAPALRRPKITLNPSGDKECSMLEVEVLHELYAGAIEQADRRVGQVLREIGDDDGAVVAVVADHGEEFLDHGGLRHMLTLYQELLHIPCIVRVPGEAPRVVRSPVGNIDLTPTFLQLAGIAPPDGLRGRAVIGDFETRPIFSECGWIRSYDIDRYGVRLGDQTLVYTVRDLLAEPRVPAGGVWERYDLGGDRGQHRPLPIEPASKLRGLLQDYYNQTQERLKPYRSIQIKQLNKDMLEKLRALGYTAN